MRVDPRRGLSRTTSTLGAIEDASVDDQINPPVLRMFPARRLPAMQLPRKEAQRQRHDERKIVCSSCTLN